MKPITEELLKSKGACPVQVDKFKSLFPSGVIPTKELALKYYKDFTFNWAASHLLSREASNEYWKVKESAYTEYLKVRESAWNEYWEVREPAWNEYEKVKESALAEYEKAKALTFVELWNRDS